jgi:hypothetical protein
VLIESGHRCAVCGAECPLERAHIVPWHKSKAHRAADLICLCANCHARADNEEWGEKALREYKRTPWVLRQREAAPPPQPEAAPPEAHPSLQSGASKVLLRAQLDMAEKVLAVYERQAAGYTTLTIPADLQVNLDEQREKVARLRAQLEALGD